MANVKRITFIIPIHNEAEVLVKQANVLIKALGSLKNIKANILLVENGSNDNSWALVQRLRSRYPIKGLRIQGSSFGRAIKHGLLCAQGDYICIQDIDFVNKRFLKQSLPILNSYDVIAGSKVIKGSHDRRPWMNKLRTRIFSLILRYIFQYQGTDTHGLKIFKNSSQLRKVIRSCLTKYELFDTELLIRLDQLGASIKELPVTIGEIRPSRYPPFRRLKLFTIDLFRIISFSRLSHKDFKPKIINADDYGIDPIVSQAVLDQLSNRAINRVSVLSNLATLEDCQKLSKKVRNVALHFNLVRGKPIGNKKHLLSLTDRKGNFHPLMYFLLKLSLKRINLQKVEDELNNQFRHLKECGLKPQYLDSEQNVHMFPPLWGMLNQFAAQHHLSLRSRESSIYYFKPRVLKYLGFTIFNALLSWRYGFQKTVDTAKTYHAQIVHPGNNYD